MITEKKTQISHEIRVFNREYEKCPIFIEIFDFVMRMSDFHRNIRLSRDAMSLLDPLQTIHPPQHLLLATEASNISKTLKN